MSLPRNSQLDRFGDEISGVLYQFVMRPDGDWYFNYLNPGVEAICEITPEMGCANSMEILRLIFKEDRAAHRASIEAAMKALQFWQHEFRILTKSGILKWVRTQAIPERQPDGTVLWSGMLTDITERKRAELAIRESADRYRTLLDNLPQIIWQKDRDFVYVSCNEAYARSLGVAVEELPGKTDYDFYPVDLANKYRSDDQRIIAGGVTETLDERWIIGGIERVIHTTKVPLRDHLGRVYGTLGIAEDITERRLAEIALGESREEYRRVMIEQQAILNTELFGIAKFKNRTITWANPGYEKMLGYAPGEAIGVNTRQNYRDEKTYLAVGEAVYPLLERGGTYCGQVEHLRRDGRPVWLSLTGVMLDREAGESLWAFVDITERMQYEADLIAAKQVAESANLAKTRFLAAASHDLWQPVHAANLFTDALRKTDLDQEQQHLTGKVSQAMNSLGDILKALLDISRLDSGIITPNLEGLLAEDLFRWIDTVFSPAALAKKLRFKLHFSAQDLTLCTDASLLRSLLSNLIGNAIRYTARGGILVGIRRHGNKARIQVWDTGIGIAPEHMGTIFEEYFQVGNLERDCQKGLGLGLSIVKRLSDLLQTQVVVRSHLGRGSVFEFCLPLLQGGDEAARLQIPAGAASQAAASSRSSEDHR